MVLNTFTCAACDGPLADSLRRLGSIRCHDCRETAAPLQAHCAGLADSPARELAYRAADGLEVTLVWYAADNRVAVRVFDAGTGDRFEVHVDGVQALDAFNHPFAYAGQRPGHDADLEDYLHLAYAEAA